MGEEAKGVYDLTENCVDVWREANPDFDTPPTEQDLALVRKIIQLHYLTTARALGERDLAHYAGCGTWKRHLHENQVGRYFRTGERIRIAPYYKIGFNAEPDMEEILFLSAAPPKIDVK